MKSGKVITGIVVGAVVALILIPKTRKMMFDAACSISDSLKDLATNIAEKGKDGLDSLSDSAKGFSGV